MSTKKIITTFLIVLSIPSFSYVNNDYSFYQDHNETETQYWSGSCIAIGDRLVATNYHVIENANEIVVTCFNGDKKTCYRTEVVLEDKKNDLAVLKITDDRFNGFNIKYGIKEKTSDIGTSIFVLGYPLVTTMGDDIKLTTGVISSKSGFQNDISQYQISAPIQPGNSGGPLFDNNGNLIGIVSAKHIGAENVSYAIKLSYLRNLLDSSMEPIHMASKNTISNLSLPNKVNAISSCVLMVLARSEMVKKQEPQQGIKNKNNPDSEQDIDKNAIIAHNYMLAGKEDSAHFYYKKANINMLSKVHLNEYARCSFFSGNFEDAITACLVGLDITPKDHVFNRIIMFSNYELQRYAEAEKYLNIYFNELDNVVFSEYDHFYAALISYHLHGYKQSLSHCEKALELISNNSMLIQGEIHKLISKIQQESQNYDLAIKHYNIYLNDKRNPNYKDYEELAKIYSKYANFDESKKKEMTNKSLKIYRKIGEAFPTQIAYSTYMCAVCNNKLDENGKGELAKNDFQNVVNILESKINKSEEENTMLKYSYHYLMTNAFLYGKNKPLAKEYAEKILAIDPEYAPAQQIRDIK